MTALKTLLGTMPQVGAVRWIGVRPARREPLVSVDACDAAIGHGLVGDHFRGGAASPRQVTLLQAEHLDVIAALVGRTGLTPDVLRRNLLVSGINLLGLAGAEFSVGAVTMLGTGRCHPCSRMEEALGPGGYNAMRGHGGITAAVLVAGRIALTDPVHLVKPGRLGTEERR